MILIHISVQFNSRTALILQHLDLGKHWKKKERKKTNTPHFLLRDAGTTWSHAETRQGYRKKGRNNSGKLYINLNMTQMPLCSDKWMNMIQWMKLRKRVSHVIAPYWYIILRVCLKLQTFNTTISSYVIHMKLNKIISFLFFRIRSRSFPLPNLLIIPFNCLHHTLLYPVVDATEMNKDPYAVWRRCEIDGSKAAGDESCACLSLACIEMQRKT